MDCACVFFKQMSSDSNIWKKESQKREKGSSLHKPTNLNFLSIFAVFDSTKSVEDNWLMCIYVIYDSNAGRKCTTDEVFLCVYIWIRIIPILYRMKIPVANLELVQSLDHTQTHPLQYCLVQRHQGECGGPAGV